MSAEEILGLAAVSNAIDLDAIAAVVARPVAEVAQALFSHVSTEVVGGAPRWVLQLDARRRALATVERARAWVARAGDSTDPIERLLRAWIAGTLTDLPQHVRKQPDELRRVATWLVGCAGASPAPRDVLARLAIEDLRRRCDATASREFVGRRYELDWLDDATTREPRIAIVEGIGGAGKSALLAKWVLRRRGFQPGGPIVLWVDFDDPGLHLARADRLHLELARQAAIQEPSLAEIESKLREHSHAVSADAARRGADRAADDDGRDDSLGAILYERLGALDRDTILLLDTVERARNETPDRLAERLDTFARQVRAARRLCMVVAGRAPLDLPALAAPKRTLPALSRDEGAKLLAELEVPSAQIHRVLDRLHPQRTPLNLRLAARVVLTLGTEILDDDALTRAIEDARVAGFLQQRIVDHLPSARLAEIARYAMLLHTITPARLLRIVGVLVEPPIADAREADTLFDGLERVVDLVGRSDPATRALVLRADVAGELRALALAEDPRRVANLHECAVALLDGPGEDDERRYHEAELAIARARIPTSGSRPPIGDERLRGASGAELARRMTSARELLDAGRPGPALESLRSYLPLVTDDVLALDLAVAALRLDAFADALQLGRLVADRATDGTARALANVVAATAMLRDPAAVLTTADEVDVRLATARQLLSTLPLHEGSAIDRARALAMLASRDHTWARDEVRRLFAARRWSALSGADVDLLREVCALAETRDSIDWAAEMGAFDASAKRVPDLGRCAELLALGPPQRLIMVAWNPTAIAGALDTTRRTGTLGYVVRESLVDRHDDDALVAAWADVLRDLRGDDRTDGVHGRITPRPDPQVIVLDPAVKELRIKDLAALLTPKYTTTSWKGLVDQLGDRRVTRAAVATDLGLAVRATLVEVDRTTRGHAFATLLERDGHIDAAALARTALAGDEDDLP